MAPAAMPELKSQRSILGELMDMNFGPRPVSVRVCALHCLIRKLQLCIIKLLIFFFLQSKRNLVSILVIEPPSIDSSAHLSDCRCLLFLLLLSSSLPPSASYCSLMTERNCIKTQNTSETAALPLF